MGVVTENDRSRAQGFRILSGKTGSDMHRGKIIWGWFIGHLSSGGRQYVFVTNISGADGAWGRTAQKMTAKILKQMKI